jgi:hypothetical protein
MSEPDKTKIPDVLSRETGEASDLLSFMSQI